MASMSRREIEQRTWNRFGVAPLGLHNFVDEVGTIPPIDADIVLQLSIGNTQVPMLDDLVNTP